MQGYLQLALIQQASIDGDVLKILGAPPLPETSEQYLRATGQSDDG
jgi:hypothetical protein